MCVVYLLLQLLAEWCTGNEESHPALKVLNGLLKTTDLLPPMVLTLDVLVLCSVFVCLNMM